MKLSLMIPTFSSAATIERTLRSAVAQEYRPLEILVYDEASHDRTREIVERILGTADSSIDARLLTSDRNSGPVLAWRIALHEISGDWCCFVWADDVLKNGFSVRMMEGAARAVASGRKLVACSAEVQTSEGSVLPYYASDTGIASPVEYSEGIFLRRFPLTQICATYDTNAARAVFERHIRFENPRGYDYALHPYGNDVGFLSELAMEGGGVELLGERLVTLVDSGSSMTRRGTREHLWQMRWQYTYSFLRVWRWWLERGVPDSGRIVGMAERRLALCSIMLGGVEHRVRPANYARALRAYLEFRRLDYQRNHTTLDQHRRTTAGRGPELDRASHSLT
ncbi:MAG: glycosyltransferase family 2 protein [Gaiellaceae bacterium]